MQSRRAPASPNRRKRKKTPRAPASPERDDAAVGSDEAPRVGAHLRRLRAQRRLSLEKLSKLAGVSRAMLGQIELGQSTPTIKTLWRISRALDVPFSALLGAAASHGTTVLRAGAAKRLTNHDGSFVSRALFPFGGPRRTEFYELHLAGHASENAVAHPSGTMENLVVTQGSLELTVAGETHELATGDAVVFQADQPHVYRNPGARPTIMYLVMTYEPTT